jgi:putative SOS response-associated peptidase YedK
MINARADTIAEKPAFRDAFRVGRCLIIADGYYEWQKGPGGKTPFRFQMNDRSAFVFAGLWDRWQRGAEPIESCTIITTQAAKSTAHIHDRMPVIMDFDESITWLNGESNGADLLSLLRPYERDNLEMFPVSHAVNNPANDTPECVQPSEILTLELPL